MLSLDAHYDLWARPLILPDFMIQLTALYEQFVFENGTFNGFVFASGVYSIKGKWNDDTMILKSEKKENDDANERRRKKPK